MSVEDLAAAMGQPIIQPYGYVKNNFDDIFKVAKEKEYQQESQLNDGRKEFGEHKC